jgi:glutamyl-Q tRNA(Asp) synthetase
LQKILKKKIPRYLHVPVITNDRGEKLSKQNGATALDITHPLQTLNHAASVLGLAPCEGSVAEALLAWIQQWPFSKA